MKFSFTIIAGLVVFASQVVAQEFGAENLPAPSDANTVTVNKPANPWPEDKLLNKVEDKFKYLGSLECSNCHVAAQAKNIVEDVEDFVLLNEYQIWLNDDPHARAYLNIIPDKQHYDAVTQRLRKLNDAVNQAACKTGEQPRETQVPFWSDNPSSVIGENGVAQSSNQLSLNMLKKICKTNEGEISQLFQQMTTDAKYLVSKSVTENPTKLTKTVTQCMSCHAGWDNRKSEFDFEVVEYGTGVSCEGCHGGASEWLADHSKADWRKEAPKIKHDKFGLYNTRQPLARSKQCYACHIGDVEQGKFVTHEMYAAGHPPLPSIEIESFADQIPRHWYYLTEKPDFKFASEFKSKFGADLGLSDAAGNTKAWEASEFPRTKNLLVGGVISAAQSARLLANSAKSHIALQQSNDSNLDSDDQWPEFAAFDCASCHHDLKTESRDLEFAGIPGRPPALYWPKTLSHLGVAYLNVQEKGEYFDEYLAQQKKLQAALDRQPFGKPDELSSAGLEYSSWLEKEVGQCIQSQDLKREDAVAVLKMLVNDLDNSIFDPIKAGRDFHSARQIGWAIELVYSELTVPPTRGMGQIRRNRSTLPQMPRNEFEKVLKELHDYLMLDLPPTGQITTQQKAYLGKWRSFERSKFETFLQQLRETSSSAQLSVVPSSENNSAAKLSKFNR